MQYVTDTSTEEFQKHHFIKELKILSDKRTNIMNKIHRLENSVNECYKMLERFNESIKESIEKQIPPLFKQLNQLDNEWDKLLNQIKSIDKKITKKKTNPPIKF